MSASTLITFDTVAPDVDIVGTPVRSRPEEARAEFTVDEDSIIEVSAEVQGNGIVPAHLEGYEIVATDLPDEPLVLILTVTATDDVDNQSEEIFTIGLDQYTGPPIVPDLVYPLTLTLDPTETHLTLEAGKMEQLSIDSKSFSLTIDTDHKHLTIDPVPDCSLTVEEPESYSLSVDPDHPTHLTVESADKGLTIDTSHKFLTIEED